MGSTLSSKGLRAALHAMDDSDWQEFWTRTRSVLPGRASRIRAQIAAAVVAEWFACEDGLPPDKELAERIPRLERREDIYPLRAAAMD